MGGSDSKRSERGWSIGGKKRLNSTGKAPSPKKRNVVSKVTEPSSTCNEGR